MGAGEGSSDPNMRPWIDARVAELQDAVLAEGGEFRIADQSPSYVAFETRPSEDSTWRRVFVFVDSNGNVQVEEEAAMRPGSRIDRWFDKKEERLRAAESRWIARHSDLIATLKGGRHSLRFETHGRSPFLTPPLMKRLIPRLGYVTTMRCNRCRAKYRGSWGGLSPERPCEGKGRA